MVLKKSKKVSWAFAPKLCQVKPYQKEDCPSKWKCPPKFYLNEKWLVVAGEESEEARDQEHRKRRVIEAVFPYRSSIPPNPYNSSDLEESYDDNQTPVIRTIPIEEEEVVSPQTMCSKSPDACLPNSPSSSVRIVTSQMLPDNGKSLPRKPSSNSPFSNVQSTPPYHSRCQNLKGSKQTQVSPKLPVNYNSVPKYRLTFRNIGTQTEISPDQPVENIPPVKSQVSGMPPAKHRPVTESPSTHDSTVAVATAVAALAKSQEQGSLIDTNLLVRLLLNPKEIPKLMNERGMATNAATGAATADSLIAAMSRTKPDKVINKPINECQSLYAGSGPSFGPKPMAKSAPLTMTKHETSVKSNLVDGQWAPLQVETANIRESKPPTSDLELEKIKKLISKYGVTDNAEGKPLVNSELVSRYGPSTLLPKLLLSPNVGPTSHPQDINSLIKQRGENCESMVNESLQTTNPHGTTRGASLLKNEKRSLTHCVFFNKPKGCRNGSSCRFLHDTSGQKRSRGTSEARDSKRVK